jgi:GTP-binding protein Era
MTESFRSGVVAIIGRPNVGKSTLVNAVVRARIAATSPRPQTTRGRIFGVRTTDEYQIAFADTPGFHRGKNTLNKAMLNVVREESQGADMALFVVDVALPPRVDDAEAASFLFKGAEKLSVPVFLVGNKSDLVTAEEAEAHLAAYRELGAFAAEHLVSAATGRGLQALESALAARLPEGPMLFPADMKTDQDDRTRAAEIIREKALHETRQEVPHAIAVEVDEMREGKSPGTRYIRATVYVEKESQKAIVVGRGGARLKKIGQMARRDLEMILGEKTYIDLWVKVKEDWRDRPDVLRAWGFPV